MAFCKTKLQTPFVDIALDCLNQEDPKEIKGKTDCVQNKYWKTQFCREFMTVNGKDHPMYKSICEGNDLPDEVKEEGSNN